MELVELAGIVNLHKDQILADLAAVKRTGAAGLSISWDLLKIPMERLNWVASIFPGSGK
jgi:hypothetical protein